MAVHFAPGVIFNSGAGVSPASLARAIAGRDARSTEDLLAQMGFGYLSTVSWSGRGESEKAAEAECINFPQSGAAGSVTSLHSNRTSKANRKAIQGAMLLLDQLDGFMQWFRNNPVGDVYLAIDKAPVSQKIPLNL